MKYSTCGGWPDKNSEIAIEYSKLKLFKLEEPHRELHWDIMSLELRCEVFNSEQLLELLPLLGYDPIILSTDLHEIENAGEANFEIIALSNGFQLGILNPGTTILHGVPAKLTFGVTAVVVNMSAPSYYVELAHILAAQKLERIYLQIPEVIRACVSYQRG
ncbi:hypothetical protein [Cellvibrio sp. QJXJ]|uniref:hypothetical protein n=1 Tax=Cellvibrio sp. QJXJ TaxID=2964606 RepID=UPI0021C40C46|nr:hypothetical protein [Cellvibrio sp. QJXJ]UUA72354.1 hypothetical protein NNX04_18310 [Cellvibrio sp. QJXJ]